MTRTPTAYVDDAARALRQARTYLADELVRIDAALAALDLEQPLDEAQPLAPMAQGGMIPHGGILFSEEEGTSHLAEGYVEPGPPGAVCDAPGCDWTGKTPQALGHHRRKAHSGTPTAPKTGKTYPCQESGCDFVATSPGQLGGHKNSHRVADLDQHAAKLRAENDEDHDGHTIDVGPVTVGPATVTEADAQGGVITHVCDECGETFQWRHDLARHRRDAGHYADEAA